MALTFTRLTPNADTTVSNKRFRTRDVLLDNSYPTGGYAITAANVGLKQIHQIFATPGKNAAGTTSLPVVFDYTNGKLQCYRYDGASAGKAFLEEVTAAVDLSTFTVRITFFGY